jgi:hypothetical protein
MLALAGPEQSPEKMDERQPEECARIHLTELDAEGT